MPITNFDKCELLLPMTGANSGTVFTDYSLRERIITRVNAVTSTTQSKFSAYNSSGLFNGTNAYLTAGVVANWNFLHRDDSVYTVEGWFYLETTGATRVLWTTGGEANTNVGAAVYVANDGSINFAIRKGSSPPPALITSSAGAVSNGTWTFMRFIANMGNIEAFVGGASVGTATMSGASTANATGTLNIGRTLASSFWYKGHMQDLTIWNGADRSAEPIPARMTQRALTRTNTGIDSHEYDRAVLFDWNAGDGSSLSTSVVPDSEGDFVASDLIDLEYGVAFIKDGCGPICRGPVEVDSDT